MTRTEVADLIQEELTRALGKHAALLGLRESDSPLEKKERRLRESGTASTSREEREYKEAKRVRKAAKREQEYLESLGQRLGLGPRGAAAFAKGRTFRG